MYLTLYFSISTRSTQEALYWIRIHNVAPADSGISGQQLHFHMFTSTRAKTPHIIIRLPPILTRADGLNLYVHTPRLHGIFNAKAFVFNKACIASTMHDTPYFRVM